jgi:hypothetical protein
VAFAKEGMTDERRLAAAGLRYLISLTRKRSTNEEKKAPEDGRCPPHFCLNGAPAKFLPQWRVRWRSERIDQGTAHAALSRAVGAAS